MLGLARGRVVGNVASGCLKLGSDEGPALIWPAGFYALDDPPRVMRPDGDVAALIGEQAELAGGLLPKGAEECDTKKRWAVTEVIE